MVFNQVRPSFDQSELNGPFKFPTIPGLCKSATSNVALYCFLEHLDFKIRQFTPEAHKKFMKYSNLMFPLLPLLHLKRLTIEYKLALEA
jgi:hypothetical protein